MKNRIRRSVFTAGIFALQMLILTPQVHAERPVVMETYESDQAKTSKHTEPKPRPNGDPSDPRRREPADDNNQADNNNQEARVCGNVDANGGFSKNEARCLTDTFKAGNPNSNIKFEQCDHPDFGMNYKAYKKIDHPRYPRTDLALFMCAKLSNGRIARMSITPFLDLDTPIKKGNKIVWKGGRNSGEDVASCQNEAIKAFAFAMSGSGRYEFDQEDQDHIWKQYSLVDPTLLEDVGKNWWPKVRELKSTESVGKKIRPWSETNLRLGYTLKKRGRTDCYLGKMRKTLERKFLRIVNRHRKEQGRQQFGKRARFMGQKLGQLDSDEESGEFVDPFESAASQGLGSESVDTSDSGENDSDEGDDSSDSEDASATGAGDGESDGNNGGATGASGTAGVQAQGALQAPAPLPPRRRAILQRRHRYEYIANEVAPRPDEVQPEVPAEPDKKSSGDASDRSPSGDETPEVGPPASVPRVGAGPVEPE